MGLQAVQHAMLSSCKLLAARLAFQIPDLFILPMTTIPYQGMDLFIRDQVMFAFRIRTKIIFGRDPFLSPAMALLLTSSNRRRFGNDRFYGFRALTFRAIL